MIEIRNKRNLFRKNRPGSNPYRILILLGLLLAGLYLLIGYERGDVKELSMETPQPTRVAGSYALEGEVQFIAGNLQGAVDAYQKAIALDPNNADLIAELARIQTYLSNLLTTDVERKVLLDEARANIDRATNLDPDNTNVQAIRAFVYDWNANPSIAGEDHLSYLTQAEQAAIRALQLDSQNALALAYYAEILVDQQKWLQAQQNVEQALARDDSLMDVHRIAGYVQESLSDYEGAIDQYLKAAEITPNFTPLYIQIGTNYRTLGLRSTTTAAANDMYNKAIENYAKAVSINKKIGVNDPIPYIAIAKTYTQMGEFFAAALNVSTALDMLPENPDMYGQLGIVYFKARNYEGAIPALKCAVQGCDADTSCEVRRCNSETDPPLVINGLDLSDSTLIYYYTYGSVLAGMHREGMDYCNDAVQVLAQVREVYTDDPDIMAIIQPSEEICASFGYISP